MLSTLLLLVLPAGLSWNGGFAAATSTKQVITIDSSVITGQLKNLQGTNNAVGPTDSNLNDQFNDQSPEMQQHWKDSAVKHVCIYSFPSVFLGAGKTGSAGDAYNITNYNFTNADARVKFVVGGGAKASAQFEEGSHSHMTAHTVEQMEGIGYMLADRYVNGAHNSKFHEAIELFDFYPEADNVGKPLVLLMLAAR
ncbi:hypothetical protein G7Z17_g3001 [Cylindrodendrum hubeiense]|uniref:Uncharacterized protein n=1 Tax=Cylindrodendrum hubeiense TaxID=595255 RepID=A0A9P5HGL3_9HYPO|nr:hypothetical protein G7Z17_g3001 [Cylindrodendrum hubeiense]